MTAQTIGSMTKEELQALIEQTVERKLKEWRTDETTLNQPDQRMVDEVLESVKHNRWTPPPGTPSTAELIHEDRTR